MHLRWWVRERSASTDTRIPSESTWSTLSTPHPQENPCFRHMNNTRFSITSCAVEGDTMDGVDTVTRHLLVSVVGLEMLILHRFLLSSEELDIFLANFIHRNIINSVKQLFHDCVDLLIHLDIWLFKVGHFQDEYHFTDSKSRWTYRLNCVMYRGDMSNNKLIS